MEISVIIPVHNGSPWLEECFCSIFHQTFKGQFEVSLYNDNSTDDSLEIVESWRTRLKGRNVELVVGNGPKGTGPKGVGFAKNRAIEQSSGKYLCFNDADDVMHPDRIKTQYAAACKYPDALIGCCFHREPDGSTERYTRWANNLKEYQLLTQVYTSHGPTIIMPTWFCSRQTFNTSGPWDETGKGTPEDLIFFFRHLNHGGNVIRVQDDLLMYRYHSESATFSVNEDTIWDLRVREIQERVISLWDNFTIWNAGRQGRKLYRSLNAQSRAKVVAFCDVDEKKISKGYYSYEDTDELPRPKVPIIHFRNATPPFILCMKQDLTHGVFEDNLSSLNLHEGVDYFHFN